MVEAEVSKADMERLNAAMKRFQSEFGKKPLAAVKWAASNLARSLKAGTTAAKEFPQVQATRGSGKDKRKYWQAFNDIHGRLEHLKWRQKTHSKQDVKRIYRRSRHGLAKRIWGIVLSKVGGGGAASKEGKFADVEKQEDTVNPSIRMHDLLNYAEDALTGASVASAVEKAGNSMMKKMDEGLVKAMKG